MKLETVGRVAVGDLSLEVRWQIYNADGAERAFLWANTTTNTKALRDESNLRIGSDLDTETTAAHDRA